MHLEINNDLKQIATINCHNKDIFLIVFNLYLDAIEKTNRQIVL